MELLFLAIGLGIGVIIAYLLYKAKANQLTTVSPEEIQSYKDQILKLSLEKEKLSERISMNEAAARESALFLTEERGKVVELNGSVAKLKAINDNLTEKLEVQKEEMNELQQRLKNDFKLIANELLEEKSKKFTEQNKENLDTILKPFNEKIKDFEKKVNDVYVADSSARAGLIEQIKQLHELNQQMSKDANNLTRALKGEAKTQGNWGELILETVLQKSGLEKGREYFVQQSIMDENGKRFQPDVIVKLPDNKSVIIDSKVTLTAYERYCAEEDETVKQVQLKEHINAVKKHYKDLSNKNYHSLYGSSSPDFVLLFMPLEPAFSLAIQSDNEIYLDAFEKNIIIVSPTTLLATLRTIANIWKQEYQNKFALEIAKQSGDLYDKFVGFVEDMMSIGGALNTTRDKYDTAMKKLSDGKGNLIVRAEKIKKLGAKTSKKLPPSLAGNIDPEELEIEEEIQ
jgi:DNA recombination protein RmuC